MLSARFFSAAGDPGEPFQLPEELFDGIVHESVLHQVVKAHLANQRQGNASTKTRGEIAGGGRKAWRQKGTGRARQGSIRAPQWRGGGVVFGPSPRSYRQEVPRKVRALARRSAFNSRALAEQIAVIERFDLDAPKTRRVTELLGKVGIDGRKVLILTDGSNQAVYLSARNLPDIEVMPMREASAYDVLRASSLLIESGALQAAAASEVNNA
ncbi:MAG: 50S ribosomal protein L4 [Gemmatimonadota bacterium]|jgi:large subunit ribosomal protein L4|nr:50S ribosomal protein L4 [Gemmatimonadota bacterium]